MSKKKVMIAQLLQEDLERFNNINGYINPLSEQFLGLGGNTPTFQLEQEETSDEEVTDDLIPKPPSKLAPRGITSFTVFRQQDETGVSGEGVVIEGVVMATGQCVVHWLYPPPRGGIASLIV